MTLDYVSDMTPQYLAGFFDGEGSIFVTRSALPPERFFCEETRKSVGIAVANTDRTVLLELKRQYGGNLSTNGNHKRPNNRIAWIWRAWNKQAAHFLNDVLPFLVLKQNRANAALFYFDSLGWPKNWRSISPETKKLRQLVFKYLDDHPNLRGCHV